MNRHLLAATDGSLNAHNSLKYIAGIYQDVPDIDVTLISVAEPLPVSITTGSRGFQAEKSRLKRLDDINKQREQECADILEKGRALLERNQFPADRIHTKAVIQSRSVVQDILSEAKRGKYDALVVGRRGLGRLVSYFIGSVSYGLVQYLKNITVWIIDDPIPSKHVLIAFDARESCLRVVDHASFALAGIKDLKVTLFNVIPKFRPFISREVSATFEDIETVIASYSEKKMENLLSEVRNIFRDAGFNPKSVEIKIKKGSTGVTQDIFTEYEDGGYGTLVIGRRGVGGWEAIFPGSVSNRLLHTHTKGALWIVA
jgi:nucleotide-binding universal stress UspA family protein